MQPRFALLAFVSIGLASCGLLDEKYIVRDYAPGPTINLVTDSPEVRRLITLEEARASEDARTYQAMLHKYGNTAIVESRQHPENYFPQHVKFLTEMTHQPSVSIPKWSYARALERSHARCEADASLSAQYWKVMITSGARRGQEGWLCYLKELFPENPIDSSIQQFDRPQHENDVRVVAGSRRAAEPSP